MSTRILSDLAAEGLQGFAQPCATLVLRCQGQQATAGAHDTQRLRQHIVALQRPAGSQDNGFVHGGVGEVCEVGRAGDQRRDLQGLGRDLDETGGGEAVENCRHLASPAKRGRGTGRRPRPSAGGRAAGGGGKPRPLSKREFRRAALVVRPLHHRLFGRWSPSPVNGGGKRRAWLATRLSPFLRPLEADVGVAVHRIADVPGTLGQKHRLLVDIGAHGTSVLAHEVL